MGSRQCLPLTIDVVNEIDERGRAIGRAKGHDRIRPFDCVRTLKSKLLLTRLCNS